MKKVLVQLLQVLLLAAVASAAAQAEWHSIGKATSKEVEGSQITFHTEHAVVQLTVLAPDIVRVRMARGSTIGLDYSWVAVKCFDHWAGRAYSGPQVVSVDAALEPCEWESRAWVQLDY